LQTKPALYSGTPRKVIMTKASWQSLVGRRRAIGRKASLLGRSQACRVWEGEAVLAESRREKPSLLGEGEAVLVGRAGRTGSACYLFCITRAFCI